MRAAIYLRTSTREQTAENQRIKLREFAAAMDWTIVTEYADQESGANPNRAQFLAMMNAASRREFDVILAWSLDRFSREGIGKTCEHLRKLAAYKISFRSYSEPFLDTTGDFSELVTAIFAFFASFERKRIIERVKAGMERARSQGKHLGRPRLVVNKARVRTMRDEGVSVRGIAAKLNISAASVHRIVKSA
jgi:DNA invertase Pin-like site-specific DNA recombinase